MKKTAFCYVVLPVVLPALLALPNGAEAGKKKPGQGHYPKTFIIEEAGIELTLNDSWFPQPPPLDKKIIKMLTSLRDLSRVTLSLIPYQVEIKESNLNIRAGESLSSIRESHPDFELKTKEFISGDPARLHVEGQWQVEGKDMRVCLEIVPVTAKTLLIVLTTQRTSGNNFRELADLIKNELRITQKPITAEYPDSAEYKINGEHFKVKLPTGWREALDEETAFLRKQMTEDGLYRESNLLPDLFTLVYPSLEKFSPTLTFRSSEGAVPVSSENLDKFKKLYQDHMDSQSTTFQVDRITIETIGGISSFMVRGTTKRSGFNVTTRQFFIPLKDKTVIVTLSSYESKGRDDTGPWSEILSNITFSAPDKSEHKAAGIPKGDAKKISKKEGLPLPWIVGSLVLLVLVILLISTLGKILKKKK